MANPEKSSWRKTESTVEKWGGGGLFVLGIVSFDFPVAALGLGLYFVGRFRTPRVQNANGS